jgi:hypothetical protein
LLLFYSQTSRMVINFCAWSGLLTEGIDEKHIVSVLEAL